MKKHKIFLFFVLLLFFSCKSEEFFIDPVPEETPELKTALSNIQDAFKNSDTTTIRTLILPNYFPFYKAALQMNADKLYDFGNLLNNMKLVNGDSVYMVYKVNYKSKDYEVSFSKDEEGNWKLMNF